MVPASLVPPQLYRRTYFAKSAGKLKHKIKTLQHNYNWKESKNINILLTKNEQLTIISGESTYFTT